MLIIDMPMPKGCYFCPMSATYPTDWYCNAFDDSTSIDGCAPMDKRPSWCPICGVLPDEHGDLIDRTLLCADLAGVILSHSGLGVVEVIARQNAVIAAERKDDEH